MEYELKHPDESHVIAVYGYGEVQGFYIEVHIYKEPVLAYGKTRSGYRGIEGALDLLVATEFLTSENVAEARHSQEGLTLQEVEDEGVRRAAEVIVNMRRAADGAGVDT